jgi:hypothetical protein
MPRLAPNLNVISKAIKPGLKSVQRYSSRVPTQARTQLSRTTSLPRKVYSSMQYARTPMKVTSFHEQELMRRHTHSKRKKVTGRD